MEQRSLAKVDETLRADWNIMCLAVLRNYHNKVQFMKMLCRLCSLDLPQLFSRKQKLECKGIYFAILNYQKFWAAALCFPHKSKICTFIHLLVFFLIKLGSNQAFYFLNWIWLYSKQKLLPILFQAKTCWNRA